MTSGVTRRDFLNGIALAVGGAAAPFQQLAAQGTPAASYPPALTGLRGSTDASFEVMHGIALGGQSWDIDKVEPEESFDLVVVGAGLAGLTAAWSMHERRPKATILILDNNDDFGGHARRTELAAGGRTLVSYGGSESMVAPHIRYTGELGRVLKALRIEPQRFDSEAVFHRRLYPGLGLAKSVFFDHETFGADRLVTGDPLMLGFDEFAPQNPGARPVAAFLADCPLSQEARRGLGELFQGGRDYLTGLSAEQKVARLAKTSYRTFLTDICRLPKEAADFFQGRSLDNLGFGIDAVAAIDCMRDGFPGARSLGIEDKVHVYGQDKAPYIYHFPDGNAAIARAMVRQMIAGVAPGTSMESLATARFDYGRLDRRGAPVGLRLEATAVVVRNNRGGVDVGYVKSGRLHRVRASQAVVATYATVMPHIVKEIGPESAELMRSNVRSPLVYTKVLVRSWQSFVELKTHRISAPMSFHSTVKLDYPVSLGDYKFPASPKEPASLHLVHVPVGPEAGRDMREQARAGRARLLSMPFEDYEKAIRSDLSRMLAGSSFDAARDIAAITVNRWSHGYSYTPSSLYDEVEGLEARHQAMRARIGNIALASSDTAWDAYAHAAMAEGLRAIDELTGARAPAGRGP